MSVVYYKLRCEWDCGFDWLLFTTEEAAFNYAAKILPGCGVEDSVEELVDAGLLGTDELVVHS